tara:strand:+ start:351 stop:590 length:240 start_codon:yes stop_codon:yes gene_type:complete
VKYSSVYNIGDAKMRQYSYFNELPVQTLFSLNGNQYKKRSTRTAKIVWPENYSNSWFYFSDTTLVEVGLYSRLAANYYK